MVDCDHDWQVTGRKTEWRIGGPLDLVTMTCTKCGITVTEQRTGFS